MNGNKFVPVLVETDPESNRIINRRTMNYKGVTVPAGYRSDGLTKLVNKYQPRCLRAALVHDYICETKCRPRKEGDQYFYEILRLDGCGWWQAKRYYWAVSAYRVATFKK